MPRLTAIPLPATRFVPGAADPGPRPADHAALSPNWTADPAAWRESLDYLFGLDLFNAGCCWESHEALEAAWRQLRARATPEAKRAAPALQAIIQIAAARIKHEIGNPVGVRTLLQRSTVNLALVSDSGTPGARVMGLDLDAWHTEARAWFDNPAGPFPPITPSPDPARSGH